MEAGRLDGLLDFLTGIEERCRKLQSLQKLASARFGHPLEDVRLLSGRIAATRQFRGKILSLKRSPAPLPTYYRFLLEYPIRHW